MSIVGSFYFAVEILKFITSHLNTEEREDEREDFVCNYYSLIFVENSDVELFHVCGNIS